MKTKRLNVSTRRDFLRRSAVLLAGLASGPAFPAIQGAEAGRKIVLGLIGPGGMGLQHLRTLVEMADVEISHVCDADERRMAEAAALVERAGRRRPREVRDLRRVLEDRSVDAVVIATPDHWHAPATILACDAGKHVYVEKPCSHNVREGRLMIEAARRTGRVVQVGTQSRSTEHVREAMARIRSGAIGEVLVAKVWNSQLRRNIGRATPSQPPSQLDFDLWLGPAPRVPYRTNLLPGSWRWFRAFGTGDMGNDGVHDLDIGRWGLGGERHPDKVTAVGGKYFFEDDQEFPDTQTVIFEYEADAVFPRRRQLIFEQRIWSPYVQEGHENGNAFYGTKGMLVLGKSGGWQLFGPRNELRESMKGRPDLAAHHRDFLRCLREGGTPRATIETAHFSTALCHLGNIATFTGRTLHLDPARERIRGDRAAQRMLQRTYRTGHWAVPKDV